MTAPQILNLSLEHPRAHFCYAARFSIFACRDPFSPRPQFRFGTCRPIDLVELRLSVTLRPILTRTIPRENRALLRSLVGLIGSTTSVDLAAAIRGSITSANPVTLGRIQAARTRKMKSPKDDSAAVAATRWLSADCPTTTTTTIATCTRALPSTAGKEARFGRVWTTSRNISAVCTKVKTKQI
jgi:hypothetical protein